MSRKMVSFMGVSGCESLERQFPNITHISVESDDQAAVGGKRISTHAVMNKYLGGDIKANFWSVNWEPDRASAIRKYEVLTGKRIPKHRDFPDSNNTRSGRNGLHEGKGLDNSAPSTIPAATPRWSRLNIWIASTTGLILASIYVIRRRMHLNTTAEVR